MRQKLLVILALVALTLAAHWRVFQCDFVNYDDNDYVTANPLVQRGVTADGLAWAWGQWHGEKTYWHPLTWMSHMLDCQFFGLRPAGHHAMNLLFHMLNVGLLFLVLERMTGSRWRSALVAAIWAIHPINVDTVAWVTERKNVLSALFWLLAMAAYARYAAKPSIGRFALVFVAMALGLLCKPVVVTLPCALLLLDFWPLQRWQPGGLPERGAAAAPFARASLVRLLIEKLPLFALSAAAAAITLHAHSALGVRDDLTGLTTSLKIQNAVVAVTRYIDHLFWPTKLTVLYLHPGVWPTGTVVISTIVSLLITGIALWRVRTQPYLLVGWLWFLGVMVPTLGLRQAGIQAMADRFAYLPMLGLLVIVVWTLAEWLGGRSLKVLVPAMTAAGAVLVALAAATIRQTAHWRDSFALWQRVLVVDNRNFLAHGNLAVTYAAVGQFQQARSHALEAIRLRPEFIQARLQLGLIALNEQKPDEAMEHFGLALRTRNDAPLIVLKTANSVGLIPGIGMLSAYLKAFPASAEVRAPLAEMLAAAVREAAVLANAGRAADAARLFRILNAFQPDQAPVLNDFAWLLTTANDPAVRNGAEAVRLAERACELTKRKEAVLIGTLAAAYAEAGRFPDATRTAQEAIDVATTSGETARADINRKLLELYKAGKTARQAEPDVKR